MNKGLAMVLCAAVVSAAGAGAQTSVDYSATAIGNGSTGELAPYFIGSLNGGRVTEKSSALLDLKATVDLDLSRRFSWGAGVELLTGYGHKADYQRWDSGSWQQQAAGPSAIWIQQLYGEVKFRGVFLRVGQKQHSSYLLDEGLSSGDLVRSSNARGVPGAEIGFIDFQNIPFTNGWVQIQGVIEYGRFMDSDWCRDQFNHYTGILATNLNYTYKRCYFRTKPSEAFSVTLGMQTAGQFGGSTARYNKGSIYWSESRGFHLKDVFKMFFPTQGGSDGYYEGNSLGSWDFKARYRLRGGDELSFAFQWPWEDGSAIGRRNGWDGLWGLYYKAADKSIVSGAAIEYIDFRNQSGAIHWAPGDMPGTTITESATGGDDYYNNAYYGAYANFGMGIGSPVPVAPIYNLDGQPGYLHNRMQGVHLAVQGYLGQNWNYSLKYSWQQAWGTGRHPVNNSLIGNSLMLSARWDAHRLLEGLSVGAKLAFDAGRLRGNNFGTLVSITYSGNLTFKK